MGLRAEIEHCYFVPLGAAGRCAQADHVHGANGWGSGLGRARGAVRRSDEEPNNSITAAQPLPDLVAERMATFVRIRHEKLGWGGYSYIDFGSTRNTAIS